MYMYMYTTKQLHVCKAFNETQNKVSDVWQVSDVWH